MEQQAQKKAALIFRDRVWNEVCEENRQLRVDNVRRQRFLDSLQQVQIRVIYTEDNDEENKTILVKPEHGQFRGDVWTYGINKKEDGVVGPFSLRTTSSVQMEVTVSNWRETLRVTVSTRDADGVLMMRDDGTLCLRLSDLVSVEGTVGNLVSERDVERVEPGGFVLKKSDKNHATFTLTSVTLSVSGLLRKSLYPGTPLAVPSSISPADQLRQSVAAALGGGKSLLEDNLALKIDNRKLLHACEQFMSIDIRRGGSRLASWDVATQGRPGGALENNTNDDSFWTIDFQDHPVDIPVCHTVKVLISGLQQEGDWIVWLNDDSHEMAYSDNIKLVGHCSEDLGQNPPTAIVASRPCQLYGQIGQVEEQVLPNFHFRVGAIQLQRSAIQHILDSGAMDFEK